MLSGSASLCFYSTQSQATVCQNMLFWKIAPPMWQCSRCSVLADQVPKLFQGSCTDFRRCFGNLLAFHGLEGRGFAPYSLRRGGATAHWRRYGQLDRNAEMGRWESHRTARIYLTEAAQWLHEMALSEQQRMQQARPAKALTLVLFSEPAI